MIFTAITFDYIIKGLLDSTPLINIVSGYVWLDDQYTWRCMSSQSLTQITKNESDCTN